jgi:CRISPR-associated protein Cmr2
MPQYLFIFSISPVQSFIAQARKTQDLYAGSQLLSKLTQIAIDMAETQGIHIIFPQRVNGVSSIPNRFVGKIDNINDPSVLNGIGVEIEKAVKKEWRSISEKIIDEYSNGKPFEVFEKQIDNHLDINWLFHDIKGNYATAYREAESLMEAIKNIRVCEQNPEKGRKCSIDGERNVKFYKLTENENKDIVWKSKLFLDSINEVVIAENNTKIPLSILAWGEGLSAVSLVKRGYSKEDFASTSEIALMSSLAEALKDEQKCQKVTEFISCFSPNGIIKFTCPNSNYSDFSKWVKMIFKDAFNWQFFYEDNINSIANIQKLANISISPELFHKIQSKHRQIKDLTNSKYYAILVFDGDRMGKIMSGEYLNNPSDLEAFQTKTSELLRLFAKEAQGILKEPDGKTVYAGGDDFLGFVNLNSLFKVMKELRDRFDLMVYRVLKSEFRDKLKEDFKFTFSAGVAIAHYKTPLSIVLQKARAMQDLAKSEDKGDRDAFGIAVLKHSGESHEAYLKWEDLHHATSVWKQMNNNNFSNKFIMNLEREFNLFGRNVRNEDEDFLKERIHGIKILKTEVDRLVARSKMSTATSEDVKTLSKSVFEIFDNETNKDFNNFSTMLNIIDFINRKTKTSDNDD